MFKDQDPDVLDAMKKYNWEEVPPHSQAHDFCRIKVLPDVKVEPGYKPGEGDRKIHDKYKESGDTFMGEMIEKYAIEGGKAQGKPNGQFWFEWEGGRVAAKQTLKKYLHVEDSEADSILCDNFEKTWRYIDVNDSGKIEADRFPGFLRSLVGNKIHLNLQ